MPQWGERALKRGYFWQSVHLKNTASLKISETLPKMGQYEVKQKEFKTYSISGFALRTARTHMPARRSGERALTLHALRSGEGVVWP